MYVFLTWIYLSVGARLDEHKMTQLDNMMTSMMNVKSTAVYCMMKLFTSMLSLAVS